MKKAKKIQNKEAYSSPEIDAFLALEGTIHTDYIRTSMLLAAQIEDAMTLTQIANALNIKLFAFDVPSDKETIVLNPNVTYQFRLDNPIGKTQPFSRI
jgi:hypothetical protein